jgi:pimeloyl-ACP methyl ester carboxylesterase
MTLPGPIPLARPAIDPGARCPLVYLPGLDGTGRLLHRQPRLQADYAVHAVSYPQLSPSSYPELAALAVQHLERNGPGILLAESFGGAVALTVALARPELVRQMVLVNTFAYFPRRLRIRAAAWLGRWLPNKPSHPLTRGVRGLFFFAPDIPAAERAQWWERTADVPMSAFGRRFRLIASLDLREQLSSIRIPTLVVAAPNDRVVPFTAGRELARLLPEAYLLEPRVGHAALIHPSLDVAALLAESAYWPSLSTAATANTALGSRPG